MTLRNLAWLLLKDAYSTLKLSPSLMVRVPIVDHHYGEIKDVIAFPEFHKPKAG